MVYIGLVLFAVLGIHSGVLEHNLHGERGTIINYLGECTHLIVVSRGIDLPPSPFFSLNHQTEDMFIDEREKLM